MARAVSLLHGLWRSFRRRRRYSRHRPPLRSSLLLDHGCDREGSRRFFHPGAVSKWRMQSFFQVDDVMRPQLSLPDPAHFFCSALRSRSCTRKLARCCCSALRSGPLSRPCQISTGGATLSSCQPIVHAQSGHRKVFPWFPRFGHDDIPQSATTLALEIPTTTR